MNRLRSGMVFNPSPDTGNNDIGLPAAEVTIAEALKPKGYASMCIGKWHLGHTPRFLPRTQGFDEYYGILYSNDMRPVQIVHNETVEAYPVPQSLLTGSYTDRAIGFIEQNRNRPFFLYLPHAMPHKPLAASEDFYTPRTHGDLYSDVIRELDHNVGCLPASPSTAATSSRSCPANQANHPTRPSLRWHRLSFTAFAPANGNCTSANPRQASPARTPKPLPAGWTRAVPTASLLSPKPSSPAPTSTPAYAPATSPRT